jgi:hypothetical protein
MVNFHRCEFESSKFLQGEAWDDRPTLYEMSNCGAHPNEWYLVAVKLGVKDGVRSMWIFYNIWGCIVVDILKKRVSF